MSSAPDPDADLMLRVKQGHRDAFEVLVDRYKQPVFNLIHRTLGDPAEAEDLAQVVFLQVFRAAHRYKPSARFSTWLYTIARNLCLNEIRRRSRHPAEPMEGAADQGEDLPARQFEDHTQPSPPDALLHGELEHMIQAALSALPETQRTAILLCRQEDLSYEDIAKIMGCSLPAIKSLIHRGRETLKQKLKPYLRTGESGI